MQLQPGQIFEGRYQIRGELGRGGFGTVYLAWQVSMDRLVALKMLNLEESGQPINTARERFMREVKIISKLRHPNTVTIHDYGESSQGAVYMILEYIEGDTLKALLVNDGRLDEQRAIHITTQIAKSLSEAHRHSIVHRDLKPANIMLTSMGNETDFVKVLDFGVAHLKDNSPDLTNSGLQNEDERELIGTPRYMSPEQVRGHQLTGASDVYSLGLMFYEMLAGEPAVRGESTVALITQQVSPEALNLPFLPKLHPSVQRIIRKATEKQLPARYPSVDLLTHDLEQALIDVRQSQTNPFIQFNSAAMAAVSSAASHNGIYSPNHSGAVDFIQSGPSLFEHNQFDPGHFEPLSSSSAPHQLGASSPWSTPAPQPPVYAQPQQHHAPQAYGPPSGPITLGATPMNVQRAGASYDMAAAASPVDTGFSDGGWAPALQSTPAASSSWTPAPASPFAMTSQQPPGSQSPPNSWTKIINANELESGAGGIEHGYNNVDPALANSLGRDLPPPPNALDNPFSVEPMLQDPEERHTRRTAAIPLAVGAGAAKGSAGGTLFQLGLTLATIAFLIISYYLVFVVIGAALERVIDGPIRLFAALIGGIILPLAPLIAEGGKRERRDVPYRGFVRFRRALVVGIAGSVASFVIVCGIFPKQVVYQLRENPNWFMGGHTTVGHETPTQSKNREASTKLADLIASTTVKAGLLDPRDAAPKVITAPAQSRQGAEATPASTREDNAKPAEAPAAKAEEQPSKAETKPVAAEETAPEPVKEAATPPPTRQPVPAALRRTPAPTRPDNPLLSKQKKREEEAKAKAAQGKSSRTKSSTKEETTQDKDYVKW